MDLLEYQGKEFFAAHDIAVPPGGFAKSVEEAVGVAEAMELPVVVKAQVHTGGRGKAGGVKLVRTMEEVRQHAQNILGLDIKGHIVECLLVEAASDIAEEYYTSFTLDRSERKHLGMLSAQGGVEIEEVAERDPEAVTKENKLPTPRACSMWGCLAMWELSLMELG